MFEPALFPTSEGIAAGDLMPIVYDDKSRSPDADERERSAMQVMAERVARHALHRSLQHRDAWSVPILADAFNPIDVRDPRLNCWVRKHVLDPAHLGVLLGRSAQCSRLKWHGNCF